MNYSKRVLVTLTLSCFFLLVFVTTQAQNATGVFDTDADIGPVLHKGSVQYDSTRQQYEVTGSGTNIWATKDEFYFVYKKMQGNFILQARGALVGTGTDPHRKFGWMIRSGFDTSNIMVSATVHGDGLTSLQFRKEQGGAVEEKKFDIKAPDVLQLERKDNRFIMSVAHYGETYVSQEVSDIATGNDVYVGLFVCAHNKDVVEKASFDNVRIIVPAKDSFAAYKEYIGSHLELMDVATGNRKIIYSEPKSIQAPNYLHDGKALIYNSNGLIYRFDLATRTPQVLNTSPVKNNNNDHVLSFDGSMLGLSSSSPDGKSGSVIYTVSSGGGTPKQITPTGPSYLHGWSPDGKFLVFTGQRNNEFDIYKVPAAGGEEKKLTDAKGLDDGPEYSPDGKYIYFNSVRTGLMQLWRMKPDGSGLEQLTNDEYNNWFPHVSPDGKWIVFLSFTKDVKPDDHPFYKRVYLRMIPVNGGQPKVVAYVYGGQGTINTPSWSPDGKTIAFISNSDNIDK